MVSTSSVDVISSCVSSARPVSKVVGGDGVSVSWIGTSCDRLLIRDEGKDKKRKQDSGKIVEDKLITSRFFFYSQ